MSKEPEYRIDGYGLMHKALDEYSQAEGDKCPNCGSKLNPSGELLVCQWCRQWFEDIPLDVGFRVFKLVDSDEDDNRSDTDLLFECALELGYKLSEQYHVEEVESCSIYTYQQNRLVCCFAKFVPENVIIRIAKKKPEYVCLRDSAFNKNTQVFVDVFERESKETRVKLV